MRNSLSRHFVTAMTRRSFALVVVVALWQMGCISPSCLASNRPPATTMTAALRLHHAPDDDADRGLTMREAYGRYLEPSVRSRKPKTITQYLTAIGHWERFCSACGITASNPAETLPVKTCPVDQVQQITDAMLDDFARWLMADNPARTPRRYKRSCVETYGKKIRSILRVLGPRETGNKRGANVLDFVPAMAPVGDLVEDDEDAELTDAVDLADEDIGRIYETCDVATWPDGDSPLHWRTYITVLAMLGPRVNDGAMLKPKHFKLDPKSPVKHSPREHEYGWVDYVQEKTGKRVIVPLPAIVRAHVDALLRSHKHHWLFRWDDSKSKEFAKQWQQIVAQAGLPHVFRKHFRPTANHRWTIAAGDREVGAMVLGHAAADVNSKHYTRNEAILLQHVGQVEYPAAFQLKPVDAATQLFLF
jgi:integrase